MTRFPDSGALTRGQLSTEAMWRLRAALKQAIRSFFGRSGYVEIDTPIGVICPGTEVHLGYFETHWQDFRGQAKRLFLRSSPELHMKQALALGMVKIFQIAPCFRNGGELAQWHHPEFTMLEWYEANLSFTAFMDQTESFLRDTYAQVAPLAQTMGLKPFDFPKSFARLSVVEAFKRFADITLIDLDPDLAQKGLAKGALSLKPDDDFETAFFKLLIEKIEPGLDSLGATMLYDYPPSQAALSRVRDGVAKRCEVYWGRIELANGFEELLDAQLTEERIHESNARRRALGLDIPDEDRDFYQALEKGIPPCCGNALGFDRWLAIVCGLSGIESTIPFRRAKPYGIAPDI
jgi:lysyl-tRNA synthetase class 2